MTFIFDRVKNVVGQILADENNFSQFGDFSLPFNLAKQYVLNFPIKQTPDVYTQIEKDTNQIDVLRSEFVKAFEIFISLDKQT